MKVVSASFGSFAFDNFAYYAVERLGDKGVLVVASAGNSALRRRGASLACMRAAAAVAVCVHRRPHPPPPHPSGSCTERRWLGLGGAAGRRPLLPRVLQPLKRAVGGGVEPDRLPVHLWQQHRLQLGRHRHRPRGCAWQADGACSGGCGRQLDARLPCACAPSSSRPPRLRTLPAAPGSNVTTTNITSTSDYVTVFGTSFACPIVAGAAALLWAARPDASVAAVK